MKKPKAPKLVTVAITTTITVIFWIFFTLYQVFTAKPNPSVDPNLLEPINPTLDTESLGKIRERFFVEEGSFVPLPVTQPEAAPETPAPTQTPVPSETAAVETPAPEAEATE